MIAALRIPMTLPRPSGKVLAAAGAVLVVALGAGLGIWFWSNAQARQAQGAYVEAFARVQEARAPGAAPTTRAAAIRVLETALAQHPGGPLAARAAYELGNLRYDAREWERARAAYDIAVASEREGTVRTLARAGIGYTWEAQRDFARAIEAFQGAAAELRPADFLYEELLVSLARVQELAGQRADAIATYRRILKELPRSLRLNDIRARLASLGAVP